MSEQISTAKFSMTPGHKKFAMILMVVGLAMWVIGVVLHLDIIPQKGMHHGGHGDDHGGGHATEEHHEHSMITPEEAAKDGSVYQFAAVSEGHGDDHSEEGHGGGHHHKAGIMNALGGTLLMGGFLFGGLALFGIFFNAMGALANAGWHTVLRRIPETYFKFLPVAGGLLLVVFLVPLITGNHWTHHHWGAADMSKDAILANKEILLNYPVMILTVVLFIGGWFLFGFLMRKFSLAEDKVGGLENFKKGNKLSAAFLPFFALSFCFAAFLWVMSLEPHWFSTIYGVYCFAGMFVLGMTITQLITFHFKEKGFLPQASEEHIHDLGKFMFAFSIFWAYIWTSQYLLIWYANLPEEGAYYILRLGDYGFLFVFNIVLNFVWPFLAYMTRNAKRKGLSIKIVAVGMLFGRFIDMFLLVMPGVMGPDWGIFTMMAGLGILLFLGGLFVMIIFRAIEKAPLIAKNHPYLEESLHHDVGI